VCEEAHPGDLIATQLQRDANLDVDDRLTIVLDPFFDHRNGFFFEVNPAGARADGQISNNAQILTKEWDGIWNVVVSRSADGWTAEIAIPFKTLRFKPDQALWGFNVERQIKHLFEIDRWAAPAPRAGSAPWPTPASFRASKVSIRESAWTCDSMSPEAGTRAVASSRVAWMPSRA